MIVARDPNDLPSGLERAVAIGTFDGVHLGHRAVIRSAVESGLRSTVLTFHPHPRQVLGRPVALVSTLERRIELLAEAGADEVLVQEFTLGLARLEPEHWVEQILKPIGSREVFVGADFRFGRGRTGDVDLLRRMGLTVRPTPLLEGTSSTRIRRMLRDGDIVAARERLGRDPELEGLLVDPSLDGHLLTAGWMGGEPPAGGGDGKHPLPTALISVAAGQLLPAAGLYEASADGVPVLISIDDREHACCGRRVELWGGQLDAAGAMRAVRARLLARLPGHRVAPHEQLLVDRVGTAA